VAPCSDVGYRPIGRTCCLHRQFALRRVVSYITIRRYSTEENVLNIRLCGALHSLDSHICISDINDLHDLHTNIF